MIRRVMVIDDEPEILKVKYDILSKAGYEVKACEGPLDALTSLHRSGHPDAIISDNQMPMMNGIELLYYLSPNAKPDTPKVYYYRKGVPVYVKHPTVSDAIRIISREVWGNRDLGLEFDVLSGINMLEGSFNGKLYLTSRSDLPAYFKSLPDEEPSRKEFETLLGFAKFFQVHSDGTGLDKLIEDLGQ